MKQKLPISLIISLIAAALLSAMTLALDTDSEKAVEALIAATADIEEMKDSGFNTTLPNDILIRSKRELYGENYTELKLKAESINETEKQQQIQEIIEALQSSLYNRQIDYSSIIQDTAQIREIKEKAYNVNDQMVSLRLKINDVDPHVNLTNEYSMLREAETLFMDELYDDAEQKIKDTFTAVNKKEAEFTELDLIYRIGKDNLVNYLRSNWEQLTITLSILAILGYLISQQTSVLLTRRKVRLMELEKDVLMKLMMDAQRDRFEKGTITKEDYETLMTAYKGRTIDLEKDLPILRARVDNYKNILRRIRDNLVAKKELLKASIHALTTSIKLLPHKTKLRLARLSHLAQRPSHAIKPKKTSHVKHKASIATVIRRNIRSNSARIAETLRKIIPKRHPRAARLYVPKPAKKKPVLRIPKIRLPRLRLPKISLPRIHLPKLRLPTMPKLKLPEIHMPRPRISFPKIHLPKLVLPRLPQLKLPRLTWPRISSIQRRIRPWQRNRKQKKLRQRIKEKIRKLTLKAKQTLHSRLNKRAARIRIPESLNLTKKWKKRK